LNRNTTAIVTGGARGIGCCIARRLLESGTSVIIADTNSVQGKRTAGELSGTGRVFFVRCDVSRESDVFSLMRKTDALVGGIDVLVNNAAYTGSFHTPVEKLSLARWKKTLDVNLGGVFLCAKHAAPYLRKSRGTIVNIASTRAFMSEADTEAYSASKGGVCSLTHALAISLGPAVRVNCISPGWIHTSGKADKAQAGTALTRPDHVQHPAGRVGVPDDIASMVLYLTRPENSFITGANFVIDGGMTRKMVYI